MIAIGISLQTLLVVQERPVKLKARIHATRMEQKAAKMLAMEFITTAFATINTPVFTAQLFKTLAKVYHAETVHNAKPNQTQAVWILAVFVRPVGRV